MKLVLREEAVLALGPTHHHHPNHPPPPSVRQSYDSPSSSSPASSSNNDPPPVPRSAGPLHLQQFNSFGKSRLLGVLPPPVTLKPIGYGTQQPPDTPVQKSAASPSAATTPSRPQQQQQQQEAGEESLVEDPSMRSFLGKIKAFEKMDHFARSQRVLELQEAQNARVSLVPTIPMRPRMPGWVW